MNDIEQILRLAGVDKQINIAEEAEEAVTESNVAAELQSAISSGQDPFDVVYNALSSGNQELLSQYNEIAADQGLHPDDDFEEIIHHLISSLGIEEGCGEMESCPMEPEGEEQYVVIDLDDEMFEDDDEDEFEDDPDAMVDIGDAPDTTDMERGVDLEPEEPMSYRDTDVDPVDIIQQIELLQNSGISAANRHYDVEALYDLPTKSLLNILGKVRGNRLGEAGDEPAAARFIKTRGPNDTPIVALLHPNGKTMGFWLYEYDPSKDPFNWETQDNMSIDELRAKYGDFTMPTNEDLTDYDEYVDDPEDAMFHADFVDPDELAGDVDFELDEPEEPTTSDRFDVYHQRYRREKAKQKNPQFAKSDHPGFNDEPRFEDADEEDEFADDPDAMVDIGDEPMDGGVERGVELEPETPSAYSDADVDVMDLIQQIDYLQQSGMSSANANYDVDRMAEMPVDRIVNIYKKVVGEQVDEEDQNWGGEAGYQADTEPKQMSFDATDLFPTGQATNAVKRVSNTAGGQSDNPLSTRDPIMVGEGKDEIRAKLEESLKEYKSRNK